VSELSTDALAGLAEQLPELPLPRYDRSAVTTGVVHVGVGGFHRAHQAMYLDRLMSDGKALEWGICGVGLLPGDRRMKDVMDAQDGLYTLVLKHPDGSLEPRVIGSITEFLLAADDLDAVVEKMAAPGTRIVSLTVTEGGYHLDHVTGRFDPQDPAIVADLAAAAAGELPTSTFGIVTEALVRRRARGLAPFTVMSCDNLQGNGHLAQEVLTAYAGLRDAELGEWIAREVAFPNSMVDRITPVTTPEDVALVRERVGVDDAWPVVCEPFTQWVLEDRFTAGRPPYEDAGVQVVEDVVPYELMKLRLLNASHQALCYVGHLMGYRLVHEACQDPLIAGFLRDYMDREATPTLDPVPGVDLEAYKATLLERFTNPGVRDTVARLCAESSDRIPKWLLPVVRAQLASGGDVERAATVVASWARYAEGTDEQGEPITVVDRIADRLVPVAQRQVGPDADPLAFLAQRDVFGDLVDDERFTAAYLRALDGFHTRGARAVLEDLAAR
jgi:mannitol 2-dehydrogenase